MKDKRHLLKYGLGLNLPDVVKLHDLPRDQGIKIYGANRVDGTPITIIFGHIDGMYSYCWIENEEQNVVHLNATTKLEQFKDGFKIVEEQ